MLGFLRLGLFRRGALLLATALLNFACGSGDARKNDACIPDDADGAVSEPARLMLTVSDSEFTPALLATQNSSRITLIFENRGSRPHSFVVACMPTPNHDGCPTESCFPRASKIDPLAPGAKVSIVFDTPLVEGIYEFRSDVPEDSELSPGQFVIL
jgi:hypothetical protein